MRRLQRGDDPLGLAQQSKPLERLRVRGGYEPRAGVVFPGGEFRPDARIIEAGGDGVRLADLAVLILQDICADAVEDALGAAGEGCGVAVGVQAVAAGFDAEEDDARVLGERVEHADGVAAAPHAGDDGVGEFALERLHLFLGFSADDGLEGADDGGERVGADGAADDVVGGVEVDDPGSHGFVDGVAEGLRARFDGDDAGAEEFDAEDVERLSSDVLGAHVDGAGHAEFGAHGRGGDAVLSRACLGDDPRFAQPAGEQDLTECVVDFVAARVIEILPLQPDVGAPRMLGQAFCEMQLARATHVRIVGAVFLPELGIFFDLVEAGFEFCEAIHQGLGDVLTAEFAEARGYGRGAIGLVEGFQLICETRTRAVGVALFDDFGWLCLIFM